MLTHGVVAWHYQDTWRCLVHCHHASAQHTCTCFLIPAQSLGPSLQRDGPNRNFQTCRSTVTAIVLSNALFLKCFCSSLRQHGPDRHLQTSRSTVTTHMLPFCTSPISIKRHSVRNAKAPDPQEQSQKTPFLCKKCVSVRSNMTHQRALCAVAYVEPPNAALQASQS